MGKRIALPPEVADFFRKQGSIGGKRSLETMTPEQRTERAKRAVAAREAKRAASQKAKGPARKPRKPK
jgi:hypothetical protein